MKVAIDFILLFMLLAIFSNNVIAAIVHGNVYDLSLNKVAGARLEINTTPNQIFISQDGKYSFDVPNGFYNIKAVLRNNGVSAYDAKNITINQEGNFVIDFILFPSFEEENDISKEPEISFPEAEEKSFVHLFVIIFVLILTIIFVILKRKKDKETNAEVRDKKDEYDKDLHDIMNIIKKEGGRTTQKEIRKHIPLSESKISLMIAELEHKGLIEKIKKGRGNIIIFKSKK